MAIDGRTPVSCAHPGGCTTSMMLCVAFLPGPREVGPRTPEALARAALCRSHKGEGMVHGTLALRLHATALGRAEQDARRTARQEAVGRLSRGPRLPDHHRNQMVRAAEDAAAANARARANMAVPPPQAKPAPAKAAVTPGVVIRRSSSAKPTARPGSDPKALRGVRYDLVGQGLIVPAAAA